MDSGKRLLVLGGTKLSCEIIRKAQEMGLCVVVTDYNAVSDSPGKQIVDEHYSVSCTDVDAVAELIRTARIDGVMVGFSDMLLPYYARICEKAQLPCYGTEAQFRLYTEKREYKKLMRQFGVPTIEEYTPEELDDENNHDVKFPVIVKPTAGSGARGITICNSREDWKQAFSKASNASLNGNVLIERYLDVEEATVFWLFQDGEYYVTMIGNRHVKHNQDGVIPLPAGYSYPAAVTERYLNEVAPKVKRMLAHTGVKNGMMFMQCKVVDGTCLVYDIGYRLTGSLEYKNLKATCGYDPLEMMIHFAVTGKMAEQSVEPLINPYLGKYTYNVSRLCAPGTIDRITGRESVLARPDVIDVVTEHEPGDTLPPSAKGLLAQIAVRILGTADTPEALWENVRGVQDAIRLLAEDGTDLSLSGVEPSDFEGVLAAPHGK